MLQRVRELAVEYNNGTLSATDKAAITPRGRPALRRDRPDRRPTPTFNGDRRCSPARPRSPSRWAPTTARPSASPPCSSFGSAPASRSTPTCSLGGTTVTLSSIDAADPGRRRCPRPVRLGPEPARAHAEQPGHLPGEPDRVREPHPRRGHGLGDGQLHQAADPAAGRHLDARPGQPAPAVASSRCCAASPRPDRTSHEPSSPHREAGARRISGRTAGRPLSESCSCPLPWAACSPAS